MNINKTITAFLLGCATAMLSLSGCASVESSNQKSLLTAAGFRVRTPETPKQRELFAAAPAYKMQRISAQGKVLYAYKDERQGVAYVGGEPEYQRYQQLAVEQRIARDNYMAAEMQREAAWGWYGAWGGRGYAWW